MGIVQLVRAPDCDSGGRRFESDYPPHNIYWAVAKSVRHQILILAFSLVRVQSAQPPFGADIAGNFKLNIWTISSVGRALDF